MVWADPLRLEQILVNLIINAQRHGQPPIEVTASEHSDGVRIAVHDHGSGVPAEAQPGLFERFTASDTAPASVGLGRWIIRQLVQAHGGTVSYEDAQPGARFVVRLPARPQASPSDTAHKLGPASETTSHGGARSLIPVVLRHRQSTLRDDGDLDRPAGAHLVIAICRLDYSQHQLAC